MPSFLKLRVFTLYFLLEMSAGMTAKTYAVPYVAPSAETLKQAQLLFERTLTVTDDISELVTAWNGLGFRLTAEIITGERVLKLEEIDSAAGGGLYRFRSDAAQRIALQAPHRYDDLLTEPIARELFINNSIAALAISTVRRGQVDLCKETKSYFHAFTLAFVTVYPTGRILQIHGFEKETRRTDANQKTDAIISSGSKKPAQWVREYARGLSNLSDAAIKLYPDDVDELGGTQNTQGRLLRSLGNDGFAHIELSYELRRKMKADANLRQRLLDCLPKD